MKAGASPLGRYAAIVASILITLIVVACIYGHTFGKPDDLIDSLAILSFGIVTGTSASLMMLNGTVRRTLEQDDVIISLQAQINSLREQAHIDRLN